MPLQDANPTPSFGGFGLSRGPTTDKIPCKGILLPSALSIARKQWSSTAYLVICPRRPQSSVGLNPMETLISSPLKLTVVVSSALPLIETFTRSGLVSSWEKSSSTMSGFTHFARVDICNIDSLVKSLCRSN